MGDPISAPRSLYWLLTLLSRWVDSSVQIWRAQIPPRQHRRVFTNTIFLPFIGRCRGSWFSIGRSKAVASSYSQTPDQLQFVPQVRTAHPPFLQSGGGAWGQPMYLAHRANSISHLIPLSASSLYSPPFVVFVRSLSLPFPIAAFPLLKWAVLHKSLLYRNSSDVLFDLIWPRESGTTDLDTFGIVGGRRSLAKKEKIKKKKQFPREEKRLIHLLW